MATVRITQEIRQEVRRKIESLFDARIKKKFGELQHLDVAMQVFMRLITPEEFAAAQKLNADVKWIPEISVLTVHIEYTGIDGVKTQFVEQGDHQRFSDSFVARHRQCAAVRCAVGAGIIDKVCGEDRVEHLDHR